LSPRSRSIGPQEGRTSLARRGGCSWEIWNFAITKITISQLDFAVSPL
jgi:hypothetical protein